MMFNKLVLLVVSLFVLVAAAPGSVVAQDAEKESGWQFGVELYLWGASVGGTSAAGGDIDISFSDLASDLDFGLMTAFGARKGKWSFLADVIYLDVEDDSVETFAPGVSLTNVELRAWVVTPAVGYNLIENEKASLDLLVGARYLWLGTDLQLDYGALNFSNSGHVWDGILGVRGRVTLGKKWYIPYYLDIGTGQTDFTWQVFGGIAYRFKWFDLVLAYRYLDYNFDDDNEVFKDLDLSGPFAGIKFTF